jgi:drug/metabolite transporter (DMT)-like permease
VLGIPVAWAWVGEAPHGLTVVGGLVTIGGVALASVRLPAGGRGRSASAASGAPSTAAVEPA